MSVGRAHFGLAALHGSIYAVGGVGSAGILDLCEKYDPGADTWVPIGKLNLYENIIIFCFLPIIKNLYICSFYDNPVVNGSFSGSSKGIPGCCSDQ